MSLLNKENLRSFLLHKRASIPLLRKQKAEQQALHLLKKKLIPYKYVLSFYPLKHEININQINLYLLHEKRLILPKTHEDSLEFYKVGDFKNLIKSSFKVPEPNPLICKKITTFENSAILVPGLGFDKDKRIGYGKGFYDRFLLTNASLYKIGVGFKEQLCKSTFPEAHDISLDESLLF